MKETEDISEYWIREHTDIDAIINDINDKSYSSVSLMAGWENEHKTILCLNKILSSTSIVTLLCSGGEVREEEAKLISESLKTNSILQSLDLSDNNITSAEMIIIAKGLKRNNTLTCLNLEHNKIQNDGARAIAEVLKVNSTLMTLYLAENKINGLGLELLAISLKTNLSLLTFSFLNKILGKKDKTTISFIKCYVQFNNENVKSLLEFIENNRYELSKNHLGKSENLKGETAASFFTIFSRVNKKYLEQFIKKEDESKLSINNIETFIAANFFKLGVIYNGSYKEDLDDGKIIKHENVNIFSSLPIEILVNITNRVPTLPIFLNLIEKKDQITNESLSYSNNKASQDQITATNLDNNQYIQFLNIEDHIYELSGQHNNLFYNN